MGLLIRGFGVDHVVWGTDSVWYGPPQRQIEAMRRLEIPEDMQKKHSHVRDERLVIEAGRALRQSVRFDIVCLPGIRRLPVRRSAVQALRNARLAR